MQLLALSGSLRQASTNTALLRGFTAIARPLADVTLYDGLGRLPIFNPDDEGDRTPDAVLRFAAAVAAADGIVVSCPEYVHALPGGFKNALDWLVSRNEIIGKPIALLHASHRGEDVLADLRRVLGTVSDRFAPDVFAAFQLRKMTADEIAIHLAGPEQAARLRGFLAAFLAHVRDGPGVDAAGNPLPVP
jgi:chromate reductase, NAD(P)H dehydrogenase (quinone)